MSPYEAIQRLIPNCHYQEGEEQGWWRRRLAEGGGASTSPLLQRPPSTPLPFPLPTPPGSPRAGTARPARQSSVYCRPERTLLLPAELLFITLGLRRAVRWYSVRAAHADSHSYSPQTQGPSQDYLENIYTPTQRGWYTYKGLAKSGIHCYCLKV